MAGKKPKLASQAVELVLEGRAILIMAEELCRYRARIGKMDNLRREDIINKEDYFFRCALPHLRDGKYDDLKALLIWFENVKKKDRELMLNYVSLDEEAMRKELERFENGHLYFGQEAEKWESLIIEKFSTKNKKTQEINPAYGVL